ncbi:MAG: hypothetical protein JW937_07850 [Candidatus Omnitrophica bacterium]|nr:hypothetical protein [Candidatus Omnitrophota bacterium]
MLKRAIIFGWLVLSLFFGVAREGALAAETGPSQALTTQSLDTPVSVDFQEISLDDALGHLADATGVNLVTSNGVQSLDVTVSLYLNKMPLRSAIKYLARTYDLEYRIEDKAVWITTREEMEGESMQTRIYFLEEGKGMFTVFDGEAGTSFGGLGGGRDISEIYTIRDVLEEVVPAPGGSRLVLDERTGALIATNTPKNLKLLEEVLYNIDITPVQVLVEARFMEANDTDLSELGVEAELLSPLNMGGFSDTEYRGRVDDGSGSDFGSSGISSMTLTGRGSEGFNLSYQGVLTDPQFQMVIHALEENQVGRTLSVPRVTTINNQTATIQVVDEFIYPTRYEVNLVQFDINGDGDFDDAGETEFVNAPRDFVTREVGVLLNVTPSVGRDGRTITLGLSPEVSQFKGTYFSYGGGVSIPQFTTRNLDTSVLIQSGETVVLGGLIKESTTTTDTKVPVLGDLPGLGWLFKRKTDSATRQNLLIFVTATILEDGEMPGDFSLAAVESSLGLDPRP